MPEALVWFDGKWTDAERPIWSSMCHGVWLSSMVFDGGRVFEGVAPDLDLHCARAVHSAQAMGMAPTMSAAEILELAREGIAKMPSDAALYVRPMFWTEHGFVAPDPASTRFALTINPLDMPSVEGFSACLSSRRRPMPDAAPTDAKAPCLYPNAGRALIEARNKGFDNAVMPDPMGNIAEFATANIFYVHDGAVFTPAANGCFLSGITRARIIKLLRAWDLRVAETTVRHEDLLAADEIFSTGNYGKVTPVVRYEDREFQPGPVFRLARELYWEFAHDAGRL